MTHEAAVESPNASTTNAAIFVAARLVSILGSLASGLAVVVWVRDLTGSNSAAALSMLSFAAPTIAYPLLGYLADRVNRIGLLIGCSLFGGALVSMLLMVDGVNRLWLVYVIQFFQGVNAGAVSVASSAVIPQLAAGDTMTKVNAATQTAYEGARLAAPLAGAILYVLGGITLVIIIDVASFAVAIGLFLVLLPKVRRFATSGGRSTSLSSYLHELLAGVRLIRENAAARTLVISAALSLLAIGLIGSSLYAVITNGLGRGSAFAGVMVTAQGVGGVIGAVMAPNIIRRRRSSNVAAGSLGLLALGALPVLIPVEAWPVLGLAVIGCGASIFVVVYTTVLQRSGSEEVLGRLFGVSETIVNLAQVGGLALGAAWLALDTDGYQPLIIAAAAVLGLAAAVVSRRPTNSTEAW
jgi:MFS family permease